MGVKLRTTVNPLEASIENSTLKVYFFDEVIKEINLPIPSGIKLERQCNFFKTKMNNVFAYLSNDKYVIIIRLDGTLDILTNDFILLKRVRIDPSEVMDKRLSTCFCGSLSLMSNTSPAYLAMSSFGATFIFAETTAATILLDMSEPTNEVIKQWALKHNDVGTLHIVDNTSNGTALWANFGTKEHILMKGYKVLSSNGIIGGIL